jgi:SagB-type dehydrogenase family enzyme
VALESVDALFLAHDDAAVWELFHENSKTSRYERHLTYAIHPSDETIVRAMARLRRVKPYADMPKVALPRDFPRTSTSLDEALRRRTTARRFGGGSIELAQLAKVMHASYGVTRDNVDTIFPRPFRIIPSGGALYPLELYVEALDVEGLERGLYHYDPEDHSLDLLRLEEDAAPPSRLFVQGELCLTAAAVIFVSAIFYRSTFKYGDRGYRFVLLEAGHLAQNAALTAVDLGLAFVEVGGYFDRDVDRYLGFDGLSESTVYVLLLGQPEEAPSPDDAVAGNGR